MTTTHPAEVVETVARLMDRTGAATIGQLLAMLDCATPDEMVARFVRPDHLEQTAGPG